MMRRGPTEVKQANCTATTSSRAIPYFQRTPKLYSIFLVSSNWHPIFSLDPGSMDARCQRFALGSFQEGLLPDLGQCLAPPRSQRITGHSSDDSRSSVEAQGPRRTKRIEAVRRAAAFWRQR
jgi:hypothetical protein